jgi:hypothetical protein
MIMDLPQKILLLMYIETRVEGTLYPPSWSNQEASLMVSSCKDHHFIACKEYLYMTF